MDSKTLVLGLDACSWELLEKGISENQVSTIESHIEQGYTADLESTIPAATCPAWKTMTTGKNPGRLNVFTTRVGAWGGYRRAALQSDFRAADYWDYLNKYANKTTSILNVPNTYEPRPLDGVMVAGRGIPRQGEFHVYPESEQHRLEELGYQPFTIFSEDLKIDAEATHKTVCNYVDGQMRTVEAHLEDHDLVQLSILVTDTYQHEWLNGQKTLELYSYIDDHLANLEDKFDDLNVVIVSDHGMTEGPDKVIWINRWLKERGWLITETSEAANGGITSESKSLGTYIRSVYDRFPAGVQKSIEAGLDTVGIRDTLSEKIPQDHNNYDINWEQTDAVQFTGGIRVRNRDDKLAEEIQSAFEEDFGHLYPDDLEPLLHRTEVWSGEYVDSEYATDLVKNPRLRRHVRTRRKRSDQVVTPFDPEEIARSVRRLYENPELRRRMGEAGRERARDQFSAERYVSDVRDFYLELMENE